MIIILSKEHLIQISPENGGLIFAMICTHRFTKAGMHTDANLGARRVICKRTILGRLWCKKSWRQDFTKYYYGSKEDSLQFLQTWGSTWSAYGGHKHKPTGIRWWILLIKQIDRYC